MENLTDEILAHFSAQMAPTIIKLQQTMTNQAAKTKEGPTSQSLSKTVNTMDELGEEIVSCCEGLHIYEVSYTYSMNAACCYFPQQHPTNHKYS